MNQERMKQRRQKQLAGLNETKDFVFPRDWIDTEKEIRKMADKLGCSKVVNQYLDYVSAKVQADPEAIDDYESEWLNSLYSDLDSLIKNLKTGVKGL